MRKHMDVIIPAAVIGLLVMVFALLIGGKVYAKSVEAAEREQRERMESTYISMIKDELENRGFSNSGVNMTKATDEEDEWEYTVTVYHHSFEWMDVNEQKIFEKELENMGSGSLGKISLDLLASYE